MSIVNDIYEVLNNPDVSDEWCEELGHSIAKMLKARLQEKPRDKVLRMSNLGRGNRYLWYQVNGEGQEPLSPNVRLKFLYGDIIELVLIALIKLAGHEVSHEQEEVEYMGIKGHIDCLIDGKLYDIKSASSMSFKKFETGQLHVKDPFGYYMQLAAYAQCLGVEPAGWIVMDKTLGHITEAEAKEGYIPDALERIEEAIEIVNSPELPDRCYKAEPDGKSGNMKLPTGCSYCQWKFQCWSDANNGKGIRTFLYSNGPRYLVEVAKLPNVPEVTSPPEDEPKETT